MHSSMVKVQMSNLLYTHLLVLWFAKETIEEVSYGFRHFLDGSCDGEREGERQQGWGKWEKAVGDGKRGEEEGERREKRRRERGERRGKGRWTEGGNNGRGRREGFVCTRMHCILNGHSSLTVLKKLLEVSFGNSDNHLTHTQQLQHGRTQASVLFSHSLSG